MEEKKEITEDHSLYKKFKEVLNITSDMRPGPNPFVVKCIEIAEEYAHDQMRWVKVEELPPKSKMPYFVKMGESRRPGTLYPEYFSEFDVVEWLYEPTVE